MSLFCHVLLCVASMSTASENFSNARQYALGGAYTAMTEGAESVFTNPANLYLNRNHKFSMSLMGLGAEISNNAISHLLYQRYNGDYLDESEIDDILNHIPNDGVNLRSDAKIQGINIGYGPFAVGVRGIFSYSSYFARELFELALKGNEVDRIYRFDPIKGDGMSIGVAGLAVGKAISFDRSVVKNFAFGATFNYLHGLSYTRVTDSHFYSQTTFDTIEGQGQFTVDYSEGGKGYGVNLATTVALFNDIRASVVVENVYSVMRWTKNSQQITFQLDLNQNRITSLFDQNGNVDSLLVTRESNTRIPEFVLVMPSIIRFGMMVPLSQAFIICGEYEISSYETAISSISPRSAVGFEWRPNRVLQMRAGGSFGGTLETHLSAGLGLCLNRFCWDLAVRSYNGITSNTAMGFGVATSVSIRY